MNILHTIWKYSFNIRTFVEPYILNTNLNLNINL